MASFTGVAVTVVRPNGTVDGGVGWECKTCGFLFAHGPKVYLPKPTTCLICDGADFSTLKREIVLGRN